MDQASIDLAVSRIKRVDSGESPRAVYGHLYNPGSMDDSFGRQFNIDYWCNLNDCADRALLADAYIDLIEAEQQCRQQPGP